MILVELFVMQAGNRDETIAISSIPDSNGMFRVTYTPRDGKVKSYRFNLTREGVETYIETTLELLSADMYPYDAVQVMTKQGPPVVISMMDLEHEDLQETIRNTVLVALDFPVKRNSA